MQIPKRVTKELLLLHTKEVYFAYSNGIYQQNNDTAMGSSLGLVLAGIFMAELETSVITTLDRLLLKWKQYVDDTFCYI